MLWLTLSHRRRRWLAFGLLALCATIFASIIALRASATQAAVLRADPETILQDASLAPAALAKGRTVYLASCSACHGPAGRGGTAPGVPDLTDADHLYGEGRVSEIEDIVRYGIRSHDKRGWNLAAMPAYATAVPYKAEPLPPQTPAQIEILAQYLMSFTGRSTDPAVSTRGPAAYEAAGCWDCHGHDGGGDPAIGAPTLTDDVWLYGGSHDDIVRTLERGRAGISPAFGRTLTPAQIRDVAVYVASLGPVPPKATR